MCLTRVACAVMKRTEENGEEEKEMKSLSRNAMSRRFYAAGESRENPLGNTEKKKRGKRRPR